MLISTIHKTYKVVVPAPKCHNVEIRVAYRFVAVLNQQVCLFLIIFLKMLAKQRVQFENKSNGKY